MPDERRRRVLIYSGTEDNIEIFSYIRAILMKILDESKYELRQLKHAEIVQGPTKSWASDTDALIVNNDGGDKKFDEKVKQALAEYFLNSGKIIFLCNAADGRQALWLLKAAAEGEKAEPFSENIGLAFEKFAQHEPVPANIQSFQVHKGDSNKADLIEYAVGLVRGDSDLSYMYFVCEDGDTAVFVVSPWSFVSGGAPEFAKSEGKTEPFWRDVLRVLRVIGVEALPISPSQAAKRWAESTGIGDEAIPIPIPSDLVLSRIFIYLGPGEQETANALFSDMTATLKRLIADGRFDIQPLKHENLMQPGSQWKEHCAVLFVDNRDWEHRFDENTRKILADYFSDSGKVVFFCDPREGRKAMWLLKTVCAPNEQWPEAVGKAYEHFAQNQPVPTDLQAVQTHKKGEQQWTDLSLGLIKSSNGAFTYLKCEDGDTAVFVAMTLEEVLKHGAFIWTELLRVVNLPAATAQMPSPAWSPKPAVGELTRIVKFINTGAAAAATAASSIVGGIQEQVSKFLKGDEHGYGSSPKPPNLLVYVGGEEKEAPKKFDVFSNTLREFLLPDRYTIYRLKKDQVTGAVSAPWASNCRVLFVENEQLNEEPIKKSFADYFRLYGGKLVFFSNPLDGNQALWLLNYIAQGEKWPEVVGETYERFVRTGERVIPTEIGTISLGGHDLIPCVNLVGGFRGAPAILHLKTGGSSGAKGEWRGPEAIFVASSLQQTCLEKGPDVWTEILGTAGLELAEGSHAAKQQTSGIPVGGIFIQNEELSKGIKSSHSSGTVELPTIKAKFDEQPIGEVEWTFKKDEYFNHLKTKRLGQVAVFSPVVPSTMTISDDWNSLFGEDNYVIITKQQTQGQGRSGNQWLSPLGSALFSFCIHVPQKTLLGEHLSIVQLLITLAAADAIHHLNEALNVRIKWPNDIYYGKDTKIGGVLVKANFVKDKFLVSVGTGINVANNVPTVCLNNFLPSGSKPFTPECIIAVTLSRLEQLIDEVQTKGPNAVLPLYYKYWLHSDQEVTISGSGENVKIIGVDDFGFLLVKTKSSGKMLTLHPDGNSFDMMANLIEGKGPMKTI